MAIGSPGRWHLKPPEESFGEKIIPQPMSPEGIRVSPDVVVWSHQRKLRRGFSGSPLVEVRTGHVIGVVVRGYRDATSWGPDPWTVTSIGAGMVEYFARKYDPGVVVIAAGSPKFTDQDIGNAVVRVSCRKKSETDTRAASR